MGILQAVMMGRSFYAFVIGTLHPPKFYIDTKNNGLGYDWDMAINFQGGIRFELFGMATCILHHVSSFFHVRTKICLVLKCYLRLPVWFAYRLL